MNSENLKIGLTLSGGGFRAVGFHLGVLSRLAVNNNIENISMISTVSGGSLVIGLCYAISDCKKLTSESFLNVILPKACKILTSIDIEFEALKRIFIKPSLLTGGINNLISDSIKECWHLNQHLNQLPDYPSWMINATTFETGKDWRFIPHKQMGDYLTKYVSDPTIPIVEALASSAAFPGLIGPHSINTAKFKWYEYEDGKLNKPVKPISKKLHLWDGGVYDNLGIEALWKFREERFHEGINFLIVSDASKKIQFEKRKIFKSPFRLIEIATDQVRSLRARIILDYFKSNKNTGAYLRIGNDCKYILQESGIVDDESIFDVSNECLSNEQSQNAALFETRLRKLTIDQLTLLHRHGWEVADLTLSSYNSEMFRHIPWRNFDLTCQ